MKKFFDIPRHLAVRIPRVIHCTFTLALLLSISLANVGCIDLLYLATLLSGEGLPRTEGFVGSQSCLGCHSGFPATDQSGWARTVHNLSIRSPNSPDPDLGGVVGDFSGPVTLEDPEAGIGPVRINLSGRGAGPFTVHIGNQTHTVAFTYGGGNGWRQMYLTQIGPNLFVLPIQWNEVSEEWAPFQLEEWVNAQGNPKTPPPAKSFEMQCAGCHYTGMSLLSQPNGGFSAQFIERNVGCEACHGPGRFHIENQGSGLIGFISNPSDLPFEESVQVCAQCHARGLGSAVGGVRPGFALDDRGRTFRPGRTVLSDPPQAGDLLDGAGIFWNDENQTSQGNYQQFQDYLKSVHFKNQAARCFDCHDPHGSQHRRLLREDPDDNSLCLMCHRTLGFEDTDAVVDHTNHEDDPTGTLTGAIQSKCIACHMPAVAQSAVQWDIHSHTWDPIPPQASVDDILAGRLPPQPNSCTATTGCHDGTFSGPIWDDNDLEDMRFAQLVFGAFFPGATEKWQQRNQVSAD